MDATAEKIGVEAIARRYIADALSEAYPADADAMLAILTPDATNTDSVAGGQDEAE
jgi:hypothetical protein